jgi:hypothetical protein
MTIGPFDRVSQTLNGILPSSGEVDDFGRRSFSSQGGARRGRRSENGDSGPYSAQDTWLSQQGLGMDQAGGQNFSGRYGSDSLRGRDMGVRGQEGGSQYGGYGDEQHSRAGSFSEGASGGMGHAAGSASAPISPVKSASGLHNESRNYSGTWSTGPSPRQAQRGLPTFNAPRMAGNSGPQSRRPSDSMNRRNPRGPSYGAEFAGVPQTDRFPPAGSYGSQQNRRAYSAGPSAQNAFPPTMTPDNASPSELALINGSSHQLPGFQPFNSPNSGSTNLAAPPGDSKGNPSYLSPAALMSPEPTNPSSLPSVSPFPAYPASRPVGMSASGKASPAQSSAATQPDDQEDFKALDELTSRVGRVALGLDEEAEPAVDSNKTRASPLRT